MVAAIPWMAFPNGLLLRLLAVWPASIVFAFAIFKDGSQVSFTATHC